MKLARAMILATILFLVAAFHQAHAQFVVPCLPSSDPAKASPLYSGVTKNGAWIMWYCVIGTDTVTTTASGVSIVKAPVKPVIYVGTVAELAKVGGRVQTILNAADADAAEPRAAGPVPASPAASAFDLGGLGARLSGDAAGAARVHRPPQGPR